MAAGGSSGIQSVLTETIRLARSSAPNRNVLQAAIEGWRGASIDTDHGPQPRRAVRLG